MADEPWQPLSVRTGKRELAALHEDIPPHLLGPVTMWSEHQLMRTASDAPVSVDDLAWQVAIALEIPIDQNESGNRLADRIVTTVQHNSEVALDIVDTILHKRHDGFFPSTDDLLITALRDGRSAWDLAPDHKSLVRRIEPVAADLFSLAVSPADKASQHLLAAWSAIYGRSPNPSHAWTSAIRACEAISKPIVEPNNAGATLGNIVGVLRAQPERFTFLLLDNGIKATAAVDPMATFEAMLRFIWVNPDRHEGKHYRDVTIEEATAVVHLAVTVVQWMRDRVLRAR